MPDKSPHKDSPLATPIQYVKGVGPKLAQKLAKLGVFTVEDLFYLIPIRYIDRRKIYSIAEVPEGKDRTIVGFIESAGVAFLGSRGKQVYEIKVRDKTGRISLKFFHFHLNYLRRKYQVGQRVLVSGEVSVYRNVRQWIHPDLEILDAKTEISSIGGKILPVYPLTEGLYQKTLHKIFRNAWDLFGKYLRPALPLEFLEKYQLADPWESISLLHFPSPDIDLELLNQRRSQAHCTLIFDEFFFLQLGLALKKSKTIREKGIPFPFHAERHQKLLDLLPFELTGAQKKVLQEIREDMERPYPMNRLIQGDVGSGKTVIALACCLQAITNGYQTALMAPTEILAEQHFQNISKWLKTLGIPCALITSAVKGKEREHLYEQCQKGDLPFVIGTHALIQEELQFAKLGFVVVDEQHRFGVLQRQALHKKGERPDILVMTATPIPRTLALTVYGDLDISVIDELPKGRKPITTRLYGEKQRELLYRGMLQELKAGHQVFVVYPLIEESEKVDLKNATEMSEALKLQFEPDYKVALLHGRMKSTEKERIMHDFKAGAIHILASTSVVEVGVDCPNATVMAVEHAERFGLSQLHQLRGRVGRSVYPSYCILMADYRRSEDAKRRLKIMTQTNDGFKIAEEDLSIRGPGEFLGTRQSGIPPFRVANLARDLDILGKARKAAFELIEQDPDITLPEHRNFREILQSRWKGKLELVQVS